VGGIIDTERGGVRIRLFLDRTDAGRRLGRRLRTLGLRSPLVLGLPRGGVPVAAQVAGALGAPFDVYVARKIGAPGHPELGIAAIAEGDDEPVVSAGARSAGIGQAELRELAAAERAELNRRVDLYLDGRPLPALAGRDVVLADDGLATGVTAEAALRALRREHPRRLVLAAPVCAAQTRARLTGDAVEVVCLHAPADFAAVGEWYDDFRQVTDEQVLELLRQSTAS
jgi:putative phosphoribosyl transferase